MAKQPEIPQDEEDWSPADPEDLIDIIDDEESDDSDENDEPESDDSQGEDEASQGRYQQRIDQLTAARYEAERRAEEADQRFSELQERLNRVEQGVSSQSSEQFQEKYETVKKSLFQAAEEGNTEKQVELTEKLADMRAEARLNEARAAARKAAEEARAKEQPSQEQNQGQNQAPAAAYAWWNRNQWFNSPGKEAESAYARQIDLQLEREGFNKETQEYYQELDNRLQKRFPELYSKDGDESHQTPKRSPVAPTGGKGGSGNRRRKGQIRLTKEQADMARELGITTPEGLKEYAREIQRQEKANG